MLPKEEQINTNFSFLIFNPVEEKNDNSPSSFFFGKDGYWNYATVLLPCLPPASHMYVVVQCNVAGLSLVILHVLSFLWWCNMC